MRRLNTVRGDGVRLRAHWRHQASVVSISGAVDAVTSDGVQDVATRFVLVGNALVGTVKLIGGLGDSDLSFACFAVPVHVQAVVVATPVIWSQTVKRSAHDLSGSRPPTAGADDRRKCGEMPLNADKNRCACPGEVNRFIARSRCRVG